MRTLIAAGIGAALALGLAQVAFAQASVIGTYTGTVEQGTDNLGLFGDPGANLAGDSVTEQYEYLVQPVGVHTVDREQDDITDPLAEVLTINGKSYHDAGYDSEEFLKYNEPPTNEVLVRNKKVYNQDGLKGTYVLFNYVSGLEQIPGLDRNLRDTFNTELASNAAGGFPTQIDQGFSISPTNQDKFFGTVSVTDSVLKKRRFSAAGGGWYGWNWAKHTSLRRS